MRCALPVHCFQRTAAPDTVFDRPFDVKILRNPNPHLGFGGNGARFCMGANLVRMEIKLILSEIADQNPKYL